MYGYVLSLAMTVGLFVYLWENGAKQRDAVVQASPNKTAVVHVTAPRRETPVPPVVAMRTTLRSEILAPITSVTDLPAGEYRAVSSNGESYTLRIEVSETAVPAIAADVYVRTEGTSRWLFIPLEAKVADARELITR